MNRMNDEKLYFLAVSAIRELESGLLGVNESLLASSLADKPEEVGGLVAQCDMLLATLREYRDDVDAIFKK
jgi:hypothetical protein